VLIVWLPASAMHLFLFHRAMRRPLEPPSNAVTVAETGPATESPST